MVDDERLGHNWELLGRPGGPNHYHMYTCSKCLVTQTVSAGSMMDPKMKVTVPWPNPWDRTQPMSCEEVQIWNVQEG